ncbi:MAG: hypothetical protein ACRDZR_10660, partial [Acidimicrobiales bacterium]
MTTQNPSGSFGPDDTADLVRSVALSSARLWEEVLERLARVEQSQAELAQALSRLQAELPGGPVTASLAPGAPLPFSVPAELGEAPAPHFVAPSPPPQGFGSVPPPPPPPGFEAASVQVNAATGTEPSLPPPPPPPPGFGHVMGEPTAATNGTEARPAGFSEDGEPGGPRPVLDPLPAWAGAADVPRPPPPAPVPPPPPPGFATGEVPAVTGVDLVPPPPPP